LITLAIFQGDPPARRPVDTKGHEASFWDLLQDCWNSNPEQRPLVDDVVERLQVQIQYRDLGMSPSTKSENLIPVSPEDRILEQLLYINLGLLPISDPVFDDLTPELKELMSQRPPSDLTGQVFIFPRPPVFHGSFSAIYQGIWNGQQVHLLRTPANYF
jgi:hypothetical protein